MINRSVVIHSDRGTGDTLFAKIAGTILSITPGCDVVDGSQGMEKDNVRQISAYLFTTVPFWPDGTLFLSYVGDGEPVAVRLKNGSVILSPNNGTATMCVDSLGMESARYLSKEAFGDDEYSLARCAAALAGGEAFEDIGPDTGSGMVSYSMPRADIREGYARGEVAMLLKTFGNITFSIGTDEFEKTGIRTGDAVRVTFTRDGKMEWQAEMTYQPSFGYVPEGDPVVFNGSSGYMDIGLNRKSFITECIPQILAAKDPGEFKVVIERIDT